MQDCNHIVAVVQERRSETAPKVQEVLTRYGCFIRVRLGLHDAALDQCSEKGLILLQVCAKQEEVDELARELSAVPQVKVKTMDLSF